MADDRLAAVRNLEMMLRKIVLGPYDVDPDIEVMSRLEETARPAFSVGKGITNPYRQSEIHF
jgi:hypothetical protein